MTIATKADNEDVPQRLSGAWAVLAGTVAAAIPIFSAVYAFALLSYMGYPIWREQASLIVLGLGLGATFLYTGARPSGAPSPYSAVMAALGLAICFRSAWQFEYLVSIGYLGDGAEYYLNIAFAGIVVCLVIEALRRMTGWVMVVLVLVCLAYAFGADMMPGALRGTKTDVDYVIPYMFLDVSAILGTPLQVIVETVIGYVLLASALSRLGGGKLFLDVALSAMGRFRGGPAKSAVFASSLFGAISGSAVANVASTGIVTIGLMKQTGYRPAQAAAIEAVASTGGQLLPPIMGAAAFIMAEFLNISYAEVALAALFPSLLFYLALFFQVHLHASRAGLRPLRRSERPEAWPTVRRLWPFLVPILLLVHLLFFGNWEPGKAAFAAAATTVLAGLMVSGTKVNPRVIAEMLASSGRSMLEIVVIAAAAGLIIGVLSMTGLGFSIGVTIAQAAGSNLLLLLVMTAVTAIIFGMGMPTTAVYVLLATLLVPALAQAKVEPIAAHLFVLYYGVLSMITPPVCLASFTAASLAGAPFMRTGFVSMRFGAVAFLVPFLFVGSPALLLQGNDWLAIAQAAATGIFGVFILSAALEGYLFSALDVPMRVILGIAGVLLLLPGQYGTGFAWAIGTDEIGLVLSLAGVVWAWVRAKSAVPVSSIANIGED